MSQNGKGSDRRGTTPAERARFDAGYAAIRWETGKKERRKGPAKRGRK